MTLLLEGGCLSISKLTGVFFGGILVAVFLVCYLFMLRFVVCTTDWNPQAGDDDMAHHYMRGIVFWYFVFRFFYVGGVCVSGKAVGNGCDLFSSFEMGWVKGIAPDHRWFGWSSVLSVYCTYIRLMESNLGNHAVAGTVTNQSLHSFLAFSSVRPYRLGSTS